MDQPDFDSEYSLWIPERITEPKLHIPEGAKADAIAGANFLLIRKLTLKKGEHVTLGISAA